MLATISSSSAWEASGIPTRRQAREDEHGCVGVEYHQGHRHQSLSLRRLRSRWGEERVPLALLSVPPSFLAATMACGSGERHGRSASLPRSPSSVHRRLDLRGWRKERESQEWGLRGHHLHFADPFGDIARAATVVVPSSKWRCSTSWVCCWRQSNSPALSELAWHTILQPLPMIHSLHWNQTNEGTTLTAKYHEFVSIPCTVYMYLRLRKVAKKWCSEVRPPNKQKLTLVRLP
jgi:hypothetical protein